MNDISKPGVVLAALCLSLSHQLWSQPVDHRPDPRQLFEKMRLASLTYSYQGSMTYEHDGALSSFSLANGETESGWTQNISTLTGPEREFVRPVDLCHVADLGQLRSDINEVTDDIALSYNFQARGELRIAGRLAQEIIVMPADSYRYGYHFAVDMETGLMLSAVIRDTNSGILERFQVINLSGEPQQRDLDFLHRSCPSGDDYREGFDTAAAEIPWALPWLPQGFKEVDRGIEQERVELVYTDGLATVSIFIQPLEQVRFPPANTSFGATSLMLNYYQVNGQTYGVTLAGEVPLTTLQRIVGNLHYEASSNAD